MVKAPRLHARLINDSAFVIGCGGMTFLAIMALSCEYSTWMKKIITVAILAQGTTHGPMRTRRPFLMTWVQFHLLTTTYFHNQLFSTKCGFPVWGQSQNEKLQEIIINLIVEQPALVQPLGKQLMYKIHEKVWFPVWGAKLQ